MTPSRLILSLSGIGPAAAPVTMPGIVCERTNCAGGEGGLGCVRVLCGDGGSTAAEPTEVLLPQAAPSVELVLRSTAFPATLHVLAAPSTDGRCSLSSSFSSPAVAVLLAPSHTSSCESDSAERAGHRTAVCSRMQLRMLVNSILIVRVYMSIGVCFRTTGLNRLHTQWETKHTSFPASSRSEFRVRLADGGRWAADVDSRLCGGVGIDLWILESDSGIGDMGRCAAGPGLALVWARECTGMRKGVTAKNSGAPTRLLVPASSTYCCPPPSCSWVTPEQTQSSNNSCRVKLDDKTRNWQKRFEKNRKFIQSANDVDSLCSCVAVAAVVGYGICARLFLFTFFIGAACPAAAWAWHCHNAAAAGGDQHRRPNVLFGAACPRAGGPLGAGRGRCRTARVAGGHAIVARHRPRHLFPLILSSDPPHVVPADGPQETPAGHRSRVSLPSESDRLPPPWARRLPPACCHNFVCGGD